MLVLKGDAIESNVHVIGNRINTAQDGKKNQKTNSEKHLTKEASAKEV